jgi:hypothetical protein
MNDSGVEEGASLVDGCDFAFGLMAHELATELPAEKGMSLERSNWPKLYSRRTVQASRSRVRRVRYVFAVLP